MAHTILVVDDDEHIRMLLGYMLRKEGFEVATASDGEEALKAVEKLAPALFIVDVMMPGMDGIEFCRRLRDLDRFRRTPILVLTALTEMKDKYAAFEAGSHDYMVKPFDPLELVFRVKSLMNLSGTGGGREKGVVEAGRVQLAPSRYVATVDGRDIELSKLETSILGYLIEHREEVISAERLTTEVLEQTRGGASRTVDAAQAHIRHLRQKLEVDPKQPTIIVTVGKKGYRFVG